jgi:hypothetical protein
MRLVAIAVMVVITVVVVAVVVVLSGGSEGDAAEDFGEFGFADDGELLRGGLGGVGVGQIVGDGYEAVGVCALVAVAADGGGDAVDGGFAVLSTEPVMLRMPSVAGAQGSLVAALLPVGYWLTV